MKEVVRMAESGAVGEIKRRLTRLVRSEMTRAGIGYRELQALLEPFGWDGREEALRNRVSRGSFPADFLVVMLLALNARSIDLAFFTVDSVGTEGAAE